MMVTRMHEEIARDRAAAARVVRSTVDTDKLGDVGDYTLGRAAYAEVNELVGWHVTDDPVGMRDKIRRRVRLMAAYGARGAMAELGPGLYISGIPSVWANRATGKWDFLKRVDAAGRERLLAYLAQQIEEQGASHYIGQGERAAADRTIAKVRSGGPLELLVMLAGQPYNVDFWRERVLRPLGIEAAPKPVAIEIRAKGKFAEVEGSQSEILLACRELRRRGYAGAYLKSGMASVAQMVIWDVRAIASVGHDMVLEHVRAAHAALVEELLLVEGRRPKPAKALKAYDKKNPDDMARLAALVQGITGKVTASFGIERPYFAVLYDDARKNPRNGQTFQPLTPEEWGIFEAYTRVYSGARTQVRKSADGPGLDAAAVSLDTDEVIGVLGRCPADPAKDALAQALSYAAGDLAAVGDRQPTEKKGDYTKRVLAADAAWLKARKAATRYADQHGASNVRYTTKDLMTSFLEDTREIARLGVDLIDLPGQPISKKVKSMSLGGGMSPYEASHLARGRDYATGKELVKSYRYPLTGDQIRPEPDAETLRTWPGRDETTTSNATSGTGTPTKGGGHRPSPRSKKEKR
jgi:hypothetical protein